MFTQHAGWFFPILQGLFAGACAYVLHEGGHIVAALGCGLKVRGVGLGWKGLYTVREGGPPIKNLFVTLAGPVTNLILVVLSPWFPVFGLANVCFTLVNLLPLRGSDGERAIRLYLEMKCSARALPAAAPTHVTTRV